MPKDLTAGRPWRVILTFAVPLLLGNVVQQLYQVTDAFIVGRTLGVHALAAVGATGSLLFLLLGFAWGMTSGFAIPTARAFGAGDVRGVQRSVAAGTLLTAGAAVVLTVVSLTLVRPALILLRTPAELMPQAVTFATVSFAGGATVMAFNYLSATIRAIGDSRTPLVFLAISCLLNVVLVIVLVRTLALGVGGAALATVVSQATSVALCLWFVRRRVPVLHVRREDWRVTREEVVEHLRLGLPMGLQASIIAIGALAVQLALNGLGTDAVAAYTTAARVDGLGVALLASLGIAVSTFVAQNTGARRPDRIRRGVVQALWMSVAGAGVLGAVFILAGGSVVEGFIGTGQGRVVGMAAHLLAVNGAMYAALGVLFVLRGALQGLGHTLVPTATGVIELVMRVGAAVVLGSAFGYVGVVWGNPLAWIGALVLLIPSYRRAHVALGSLAPAAITRGAADVEADAEADVEAGQPYVIEGPTEGSMVVDAVIPHPSSARRRGRRPVRRHRVRPTAAAGPR